MSTTQFDQRMERIEAGERLSVDELRELAATPDVVPLGMLADGLRRRLKGKTTTFLRVAYCGYDKSFGNEVTPLAREIRITGNPDSIDVAVSAVTSARAAAGGRTVSAYSWPLIERLAEANHERIGHALDKLRGAGLDALAEFPLDAVADPSAALERLTKAGFEHVRLTIDKASASDRFSLLVQAAELRERFAFIQAINPLPMSVNAFKPTTGYDDVKMVALARLAAPNIASVQVDWPRYGPKLAQVALTFGADDVYGISPSDDAPEGRRRAPIEEIRRNIEAAGFQPVERDGKWKVESGK